MSSLSISRLNFSAYHLNGDNDKQNQIQSNATQNATGPTDDAPSNLFIPDQSLSSRGGFKQFKIAPAPKDDGSPQGFGDKTAKGNNRDEQKARAKISESLEKLASESSAEKYNPDHSAINPNDPKQGGVGDCYLISSMSAIARKHPEVILRNIQDLGNGRYRVTFYREKEVEVESSGVLGTFKDFFTGPRKEIKWIPETVDVRPQDYLPNGAGSTDRNVRGQQELWPKVLEAGYKLFIERWDAAPDSELRILPEQEREFIEKGGIEAGFPGFTMEHLTGKSSQDFTAQQMSPKLLRQNLSKGDAITFGAVKDDAMDTSLFDKNVLVSDHAYTVLDIKPNNDVVLTNPWNANEIITVPWDQLERSSNIGNAFSVNSVA